MAPLHRSIVASLPKRSTPSSLVALDGSYDVQTNRAEMGEKIAVFFRSKVGIPTTVIGLPETDRAGADLAPSALAPTIAGLNAADLIFLGPGSPSRALRRWGRSPIVEQLITRIQNLPQRHRGGTPSLSMRSTRREPTRSGSMASTLLARSPASPLRSSPTGTTTKVQHTTPHAASSAKGVYSSWSERSLTVPPFWALTSIPPSPSTLARRASPLVARGR